MYIHSLHRNVFLLSQKSAQMKTNW